MAWFPLEEDDGEYTWIRNKLYENSNLVIKKSNSYSEFVIQQGISIYKQYEKNHELFIFVSKPFLKKNFGKILYLKEQ